MPIDFPDGPECSVYGYTYDSNCTGENNVTLGYDQNFSVVSFENGNTAWVPLAGVYQGRNGSQGFIGRDGPDAGNGSQGPQGPTGAPGEGADNGNQGPQGDIDHQGPEPAGYNSDTVDSDRYTIGLSGEYTVPFLNYSGLETVAPATNRLFQIYVQPGRNDLADGFTQGGFLDSFGAGYGQTLRHPTFLNPGATAIAHPTRHVNPDDLMYFSLWRQDLFGPIKWQAYDNFVKNVDGFGGLRNVFAQASRLLFSTPQGYCGGIDTKGITAIADHGDRPVMGRVIEFPYVDLFREFQGANPSNTAGYSGGVSQKPLGTLPVAGRPGLVRDNMTDATQEGALSAIRRWNIKNLGAARIDSSTSAPDSAGSFTRNPFSYAPLNLLPAGSDDESWATVYGGRMPYMFYYGGPIIPKDGDTDAFNPSQRWNSTKGADAKHAIYIQDLYKGGPKSGSTLPSGSSGPWPLRQTMHFNGYKYTDAGATTIDKIVFLTGTGQDGNYPCPLGTGGSVTLIFSQNNPGTGTGGPTYAFESIFEFVAGSCADTDPKINSFSDNVRFDLGSTLSLGASTGDVDVFNIFCTGLLGGGETGYLISHQQYLNAGYELP